jgi:hypothetical protein
MNVIYKSLLGVAIASAFFAYGFADWHFWAVFALAAMAMPTPRRAG